LRAIIDLDALAVAHDQGNFANRAGHSNGSIHFGRSFKYLNERSDIAIVPASIAVAMTRGARPAISIWEAVWYFQARQIS
jgi:hypothetical protein